jgi:hypothetical protein
MRRSWSTRCIGTSSSGWERRRCRLAVDAVAAACGRELDLYDVTVMPASAVQASVGHEVPRIAD